jgi:hypothetical protein
MPRMRINYLDRKDRIIAFYVLGGEFKPQRVSHWTRWLEDASLEADAGNYPGAPAGWAKFEIVPINVFRSVYAICNQCRGVAKAVCRVDDYFVLDCPACGCHLQDSVETQSPGEPAPRPELTGDEQTE